MPQRPAGFTLIELLVVVAIIAVLAGMLLPAIGSVRDAAHTSRCAGNFRQIGAAVQQYAFDHDDQLPWSWLQNCAPVELGYAAGATGAWCDIVMVGQYIDGKELMGGNISGGKPFRLPWRCPQDTTRTGLAASWNGISYGLNCELCPTSLVAPTPAFWSTIFPLRRLRRNAETILGAETLEPRWVWWKEPASWPTCSMYDQASNDAEWGVGKARPYNTWLRHRQGGNFLFVDGHVQWRNNLTDEVTTKTIYVRDNDWP